MHRAAVLFDAFSQPVQVGTVIIVRKKDRLSIVATLDNMRRHARQIEPWFSRHLNILVLLGLEMSLAQLQYY